MWKPALLALLLSGCAAFADPKVVSPRPRAEETIRSESPVASDGFEGAVVRDTDLARSDEASRSSSLRSVLFAKRHVIGATPPAVSDRPKARHLIDVNLRQAKTADALQFLADAGGFNLVMQGDLALPVTVSLRRVDAFDALVIIASVQHLGVEMDRGIVVVGRSAPSVDARPLDTERPVPRANARDLEIEEAAPSAR
jgi:hypothetical protein